MEGERQKRRGERLAQKCGEEEDEKGIVDQTGVI